MVKKTASKNVSQSQLYVVFGIFGVVLTVVLLVLAVAAWAGNTFANDQIKSQLTQEKISFLPAGSAGLDPAIYPGLQQYAGQPVDSGIKAKAYADEYIWVHMMKASGGKTYAEVSTASMANPDDKALTGLKAMMFQGDMLRSSLLTAYAFSVFGMIAGYALPLVLALAGIVVVLTAMSFAKSRRV